MIRFNDDGTISLIEPCDTPYVVSPTHPHINKFRKVMQTHDCRFYGYGLYLQTAIGSVHWASAIIPYSEEALTALHLQIPLLPVVSLEEYNRIRIQALEFMQTPNMLYPYCDIERATIDTVIGLSNSKMEGLRNLYGKDYINK